MLQWNYNDTLNTQTQQNPGQNNMRPNRQKPEQNNMRPGGQNPGQNRND